MKIWQTAAHSDSGIDLEGGDSKGEGWRGWVEGDGGGNLMPRRCDNGPLPQEIPARGWEKEEKKKEKKRRERGWGRKGKHPKQRGHCSTTRSSRGHGDNQKQWLL